MQRSLSVLNYSKSYNRQAHFGCYDRGSLLPVLSAQSAEQRYHLPFDLATHSLQRHSAATRSDMRCTGFGIQLSRAQVKNLMRIRRNTRRMDGRCIGWIQAHEHFNHAAVPNLAVLVGRGKTVFLRTMNAHVRGVTTQTRASRNGQISRTRVSTASALCTSALIRAFGAVRRTGSIDALDDDSKLRHQCRSLHVSRL